MKKPVAVELEGARSQLPWWDGRGQQAFRYQCLEDNHGSLRSITLSKLRSHCPSEAVRHIFAKSYNLEKTLNVIKMFGGIEHMLDALASNDRSKSPPGRNVTRVAETHLYCGPRYSTANGESADTEVQSPQHSLASIQRNKASDSIRSRVSDRRDAAVKSVADPKVSRSRR
jgi:hypothetical protein